MSGACLAEQYTQVVNSFLRDASLSAADVRVGAVIASYANSEAIAWPGTRRLARETGLSRHIVERARGKLVKGGWLKKIYVRDRKGKIRQVHYHVTTKILARRAQ